MINDTEEIIESAAIAIWTLDSEPGNDWPDETSQTQEWYRSLALYSMRPVLEELMKIREELNELTRNPHLPKPSPDGKHLFGDDNKSYRCTRCGVYNRTDSPPFHDPCKGAWKESGKMRSWAADEWKKDKDADPVELKKALDDLKRQREEVLSIHRKVTPELNPAGARCHEDRHLWPCPTIVAVGAK